MSGRSKSVESSTEPRNDGRTRGQRVIAFIEKYCVCPEGESVGKPLRLEPFQKDFILAVYDNPYGTHTAYLSLGRKNGKTALIAAILLCHICGPEARKNSQIVSGARSKEQAAIIFDLACKMINASQKLSGIVKIHPSGKRLTGLLMNVSYKALSAEGKTTHGLSPILAILDEVGQVKGPIDPFVSAITTAQGAYRDPLLIAISTQAPTDADMFSIWIDSQKSNPDPRVVCHIYTAEKGCDILDRNAWAAANPALGIFRSIEDVEKQALRASNMPTNEAEFRNLILNQRVESASPFVTPAIWQRNSSPPRSLTGKKVWCGLDLSAVRDLTAFVAVGEEDDIECTFWLPESGLREKSKEDKVPYDIWARDGILSTTPGEAIEYEYVAQFLRGFFDSHDVQKVAFDRYNIKFLKPWLLKENFSEKEIEDKFQEFGQGTASMTPALRELETRLANGRMKHGDNPILNMCSHNARVIGDSGARKLDKQKSRGRIDGMVALAMAVGVKPIGERKKQPSLLFLG